MLASCRAAPTPPCSAARRRAVFRTQPPRLDVRRGGWSRWAAKIIPPRCDLEQFPLPVAQSVGDAQVGSRSTEDVGKVWTAPSAGC
jgi:hypothetical protein